MRNLIFCISLVLTLFSCNKEDNSSRKITFIGSVLHEDTKKGVEGVKVITEYGELCCVSIKNRLGGDSTITDKNGNYKIELNYPIDSLRYRFVTFIPTLSLADRFYLYFGNKFIDYGVTQFEYSQMAVPSDVRDTLKNDHVQTCNFTVLPIGILTLNLEDKVAPVGGDTIYLTGKRLDKNNTYINKEFWPSASPAYTIPLLADVQTEMKYTIVNLNGIKTEKSDTFTLRKGEKKSVTILH